jgi:GT2 family glycosyltransferase
MNGTTLVTVGITAYNAEATLRAAVASALAQTLRPLEVVIVDDCSIDGTRDLMRALAAENELIRTFFNESNLGVGGTRNRILQEARGVFVAFFDDDDRSDPERLACQVARIEDYERRFAPGRDVICHTARLVVYPDGRRRVERTMGELVDSPAPAGIAVARRILLGEPLRDAYGACPTCSQMARAGVYRSLGGFDPNLRRSEDTEFNIRLARSGGHFVGIGTPLVTQVMTRSSDKSIVEEHRSMILIMQKHRDIMGSADQYEFSRRWLAAKYLWLAGRRGSFLSEMAWLVGRHPVRVLRRLAMALPNHGINRAFGRFHRAEAR